MIKGVYLSLMALIFMATTAVAESQPVGDDCVAAVRKECSGHSGTKLTDMLTLQCKNRQSQLQCEQMKQASTEQDKAKFASCSDSKTLCDATETADKLYACANGVGGVIYNIAHGLIMLGPTLFEMAKNIQEPGVFANCYENNSAKLAYMGPLRPKDMTDESIQKASCSEIQKFTKEKVKVILAKIETRRQDELIRRGKENLTAYDLKLSDSEVQALNFELAQAGILKKAQCFTSEEAVKVACAELTKATLIIGGKRIEIGTVISHQGFVIQKNGVAYLRNASSIDKKIVDTPLVDYMRGLPSRSPDVVGLNIQRLTGNAP